MINIDWEAVGDFISRVGFPVAVASYVLVVGDRINRRDHKEILGKLTEIAAMWKYGGGND